MNYKLLITLLLLTSFSVSAEERWFEVELLLFQRNTQFDDNKEDLSKDNISIDTSKSIPLLLAEDDPSCTMQAATPLPVSAALTTDILNTGEQTDNIAQAGPLCFHQPLPVIVNEQQFAAQLNGFQYLPPEQLQLTPQREKLMQHASFKPLLHIAFRMPVKSSNTARPLHLFGGENYARQAGKMTPTLTGNGAFDDQWAIDGNFKIYLNHYLFIDSQLIIRQLVTQDIIDTGKQAEQFEIISSENDVQLIKHNDNLSAQAVKQETVVKEALFSQNRRLRSGEIHYFDHPLMGIIVQIRKIPEE